MKKIITVLLALILWLPAFHAAAQAETKSFSDYEVARGIIGSIYPEGIHDDDGVYTRGEFVSAVVSLMGDIDTTGIASGFSDVSGEHEYFGDIALAERISLIDRGALFYPDVDIAAMHAVKIAVNAIGYEKRALVLGGYPTGYLLAAREADILGGISITEDKKLSYSDGLNLLYNMLHADVIEAQIYGSETKTYVKTKGKNMLAIYHNIYTAESIMDANEYTGLYDMFSPAVKGTVKVGGVSYAGNDYMEYIGRRVLVYYRGDDDNTIVFACPRRNEEVTFASGSELFLAGGVLKHISDTGKTEQYNLSHDHILIYNNKNLAAGDFARYINPASGNVTILDNDRDGEYEVIFVRDIEYGVVSHVNEFQKKIYDKYKIGGVVDLSADDMVYKIIAPNGRETDISQLKEGSVAGYAFSDDNKLCYIYIYDGYKSGIITDREGDSKIYIDGEVFELSAYYRKNINSIKLGTGVVCFFGENNLVVNIDNDKREMLYGFLVATQIYEGLSAGVDVKIFNQNGVMVVSSLADTVSVDGTPLKKAVAYEDLKTLMAGDDSLKVLKYSVNAEGKINKILKSRNILDLGEIAAASGAEQKPVLYCSQTCYYRYGVFSPLFHSSSKTAIITIPTDESLRNEDKEYAVIASSDIESGESYFVSAYDVDAGGGAAFVVISSGQGGVATISETSPSAIVERVFLTANDADETVYGIQMYLNGAFGIYYSDENTSDVAKTLEPGDIIRVSIKNKNVIGGLKLDFAYETKTTAADVLERNNTSGATVEYLTGHIYGFFNNYAVVVPYKTDMSAPLLPANTKCMSLAGNVVFVKFEKNKGNIISAEVYSESTLSNIESYLTAGNEADYLVSRQRYRTPSLTVIYIED